MERSPIRLEDLVIRVQEEQPGAVPLDQLRRSVVLADHLGVLADQLVGHFVDQARDTGASWAEIGNALGVTKQAVQKRFVTARLRGKSKGLFTRFDDDAQAVAIGAMEHARRLGHDHIDTGHIVLALLDDPNGVTRRALLAQGVQVAEVQEAINTALGPARGEVPADHIPFTADSKKVLELSLREALRMKAGMIGPEHILLGILRDPKTLGTQTLTSLGVDRKEVEKLVAG
jgi:hypothetical protein